MIRHISRYRYRDKILEGRDNYKEKVSTRERECETDSWTYPAKSAMHYYRTAGDKKVERICVRGWLCFGFMGLITVVHDRRDFVWVNRDLPRPFSLFLAHPLVSFSFTCSSRLLLATFSIAYRVIAFSARKCPLSTFRLALYPRAYVSILDSI